jgi:hypothetical protein
MPGTGWSRDEPPDHGADMQDESKVIETEIVRESSRNDDENGRGWSANRSGPPIHPLAALLLLIIDNLWLVEEWAVIAWVVTIPLSFLSVFATTFAIQKVLKRDSNKRAFAYALLLGVIAAVPTSITGTPLGLALLAWTGISKLTSRTSG